jgi:hypothetical protein
MTRTMTLCIVITSVSISAISAQTPSPAAKTTVTGCIAPVQRDGSLGNKTTLTPPTPENAANEANNPEPTGRFMLTDAVPANPAAVATSSEKTATPARTSYALRGREQELAKHVGHRVEITGALVASAAAKLPSKTAATAEGITAVQVETVKMLGTNCSPGEK